MHYSSFRLRKSWDCSENGWVKTSEKRRWVDEQGLQEDGMGSLLASLLKKRRKGCERLLEKKQIM